MPVKQVSFDRPVTRQEVERLQAMAKAMRERPKQQVGHPLQAAANFANDAASGITDFIANRREQKRREALVGALQGKTLPGLDPEMFASMMNNDPDQAQQMYINAQIAAEQARREQAAQAAQWQRQQDAQRQADFGQLSSLLASLNTHVGSGDHDTRYWRRTETVNNADTVDGQHASAFALAGHDHDARYMRRVYLQSDVFAAGQSRVMTTLADRPDLVTVSYNYLSSGVPQATTYIRGALTADIRAWVTKQSASGDKDYQITVQNLSSSELYINVAAYRVGT